ncbi:MAG TPA: ferrochelatase [Candidatus Dormibacteraeota bacterium]|nr:ferrochelatase [Candidatus Dormibacteraeota bacterium]
MTEKKKIGIVLFQLGGPDSANAVEPFLYNLFCDPDIIDFFGAWFARRPLARWIARKRAAVVQKNYDAIGGHSPIRALTERQARALEAALAPHCDAKCFIAMRYWNPLTAEAAAQVRAWNAPELVLLPLYPQYSFATTSSSLKEWKRVFHPNGNAPQSHTVETFFSHPLYVQAVAEKIALSLTHFDEPDRAHIVFSAHGLPLSLIERGDPYAKQVEETVRLVMRQGGWKNPHTLAYQSKVGRREWLSPSLTDTIDRLGRAGEKHLLVVPVAFVTEHIETLHEINIEARERAHKLGIEQFEMMPAVGDSPTFISALADLVLRSVSSESAESAANDAQS